MRILHLTDFHYRSEANYIVEQKRIVDALLKALSKEKQIDFLFFTGDLVFSGKQKSDFQDAKTQLIDAIVRQTNIPKEHVFICGGNHDVARKEELEDVKDTIQKINSEAKLNEFINKQNGRSFDESLKNLQNYIEFQKEFYNEYGRINQDNVTSLYTVHRREFQNKKLGIVSLNSAWRAIDSDTDRGNLLYPISLAKQALEEIKNQTDFRILLIHHPLSDFKDWNASTLEDIIYTDYHSMFSGHVHKKKQFIQLGEEEGIFCCTSPATLALDNSYIGYTIIDIDLSTYEIEIWNRKYEKSSNSFYVATEAIPTAIPVNQEKKEQNEFRKVLRKRYADEVRRADELFIAFDEHADDNGFLQLFTNPILKYKTKTQIAQDKSGSTNILIDEIIEFKENVVLYGKDKSGKTSILYRIFLLLLNDFTIHKTIPIYIDCKHYVTTKKSIPFYTLIARYYEMSNKKAEELTTKYSVKLLLDNYDINCSHLKEELNTFLQSQENITFIATAEDSFHTSFDSLSFKDKKYVKVFIHEISRSEVRSLANRWPNLTQEKRDLILDKIFAVFSQLNIPTNYWTVSLFIWIFEKNHDTNFNNSFDLIQLYIDNLLDKRSLALDKSSKLNFEDFKIYLSELAHYLVLNHKETVYSASFSDIVQFTEKYREENKKFVVPVKEIVDLIINKGILRHDGAEKYAFRLNGVYEYFLAYFMHDNETFRNAVIADDHFYLSFSNELELCSGFNKRDREFVLKIFSKTQGLFSKLFATYGQEEIDVLFLEKISEIYEIEMPIKQLKKTMQKALTPEKQDKLLEELQPTNIPNSEVTPKEYYDTIENNADNIGKALFILARVFRNSSIKDDKFNDEVFDFILTSYCYLGFKIIDEAKSGEGELFENLDEEDEKLIIKLMTNFMPVIMQTAMFDAIGQNNLERILQEKIEQLKKDSKKNQFKLMLLYYCLIDLDIKANKKYIDDVIELISIPALRNTTLLKLHVYSMFKTNGSPALDDYLKEKIEAQEKKIKPEIRGGVRPHERKGKGKVKMLDYKSKNHGRKK